MKIIYYALAIIILMTSCSVSSISYTARTSNIEGPSVIQRPTIVDLNVIETKITATISSKTEMNIEELKQNAVATALKNSNADILIEPVYLIEESESETKVTVTGYPATFKNFRPITEQELYLLNIKNNNIKVLNK